MNTSETLRWWAEQFRTRTSEFYTSHVLAADLNHAADEIESLERENTKLRELVIIMWPVFIGIKRATFADRLRTRHEIDELGVEVN